MTYTLYGKPGFGSACVEATLELLGLDYTLVEANPLGDAENRARVAAVNPLGQVPTLILPDGRAMTESAAILIYLGDLYPDQSFAPAANAPERPDYLRWLSFLATSVYSTFTLSDGPERFHPDPAHHKTMLEAADVRRKDMLVSMDAAFAGQAGPYLLGERLSFLDVYLAMMSRWDPGRESFDAHCPHLRPCVERTEQNPAIARVWARNFKTAVPA
ncbi:glutathione S-transferase family protein [Maricaulis parjimensis]|uniref:glutathione S-transferase family protein n=1 Tax=Maricaulis parjimensis TaxID=144023 RepID=UPI00193ABEFB|nr:glutathione S-transferase family protein [Maricaulis parjimensis]